MKKTTILTLALAALLAGCSDGIPNVADPKNIVVDGKQMTQRAFLEKYCADQTFHKTCVKVSRAMVADSAKGPVPRF